MRCAPKMTNQLRSIRTFTCGVMGFGTIIRAQARMLFSAPSARLRGSRHSKTISDYVFLDDELFTLLRDPVARSQLRSVLINRYFADQRARVIAIAERESEIAQYQRRLEEGGRIAEDT